MRSDPRKESRVIALTPPKVSADYIKETITCIRGHRNAYFV